MKKRDLFLPQLFSILIIATFLVCFDFTPAACSETGEVKTVFIKDGESFDFIYIPAGSFLMGSDLSDADRDSTEWPAHAVKISKGFWLLKNEVTQSQWQSIMKTNPSYFKNRSDAGN
ncbi:MAG TPA: SUMF1/EgtB/PvdO family nonheme iron enzyme, partial [Candidatus Wallbacteria bacterium]|nr:SUMF1/EgtB/PvdO family nonheme iron enzyme [Candidatus Wallbacteria bacterium]